jgi:hypothetical protein
VTMRTMTVTYVTTMTCLPLRGVCNPYPRTSTRVPHLPACPTSPLPSPHPHLTAFASPSCANTNVNTLCVRVRICMQAWHFSHCSHLFVLTRLGVLPTILHPHCHPQTKTQQQHNSFDVLALTTITFALSLVLSDDTRTAMHPLL